MDTIYSQPPKIRAPTIRSARPLFADRPAIPPFSQRTNKRVRIFLNSNGLRCGFLTTSILGGWGRLGPLESPGTSTKNGHGGRGAAGPAGGGGEHSPGSSHQARDLLASRRFRNHAIHLLYALAGNIE
jgi:hypothetical protein